MFGRQICEKGSRHCRAVVFEVSLSNGYEELSRCNCSMGARRGAVVTAVPLQAFKLVRVEGDFEWHEHKNTDEAFIVLEGSLRIDFRDGHVAIKSGEMFVVPKGVEHKPYAGEEVKLLLVEPRGVLKYW